MARIRSIHPGFFTDERLVETSIAARMLFLGLGVEADDSGIFEWKPLTLKMRIFPADNLDVPSLLSELVAADAIQKYELNGRQYGAIRNFRKYQRPKKPNSVHPMTPEIGTYVALTEASSELDDDEAPLVPPKGEIAPQMEDGGDKMEDEGGRKKDSRASPPIDGFIEDWNHLAAKLKIPKVQRLTDARKSKFLLRLADIGGPTGWQVLLEKIENSRFLSGKSSGFCVTFDWVLNPTNLTKIMEGNYDERPNGSPKNDPSGIQSALDHERSRVREGGEDFGFS